MRYRLCVALMVVVTATRGESVRRPATNLARNPSFELDANNDGLPDGWKPFDLCTPYRTTECALDAHVAHTGQRSAIIAQGNLYLVITGTGGWIQRDLVNRGGGRTFRVSVYARAAKPKKSNPYVKRIFPTRVRLYLFGEDTVHGPDYTGAASPIFEVGPEWKKLTHTVTFEHNITKVSLILAREAQIGGGDVSFDDVEVVEMKK